MRILHLGGGRWTTALVALPLAVGAIALTEKALANTDPSTTSRVGDWSEETLELVSRLPVQDGGRVKPLSTVAGFTLLRIHHKRSCKDDRGNKLDPVEWLLDVMFYPEEAQAYPLFRVESHEVMQALGISHEGKKERDVYAYEEIAPRRERLIHLSHSYSEIDAKKRTPVQGHIVNLGHAVMDFERLLHFLDFARADLAVDGVPMYESADDAPRTRTYTQIVAEGPELVAAIRATPVGSKDPEVTQLLSDLSDLSTTGRGLRLFAPIVSVDEETEWTSPGELAAHALMVGPVVERHLGLLASLQAMVASRDHPDEFQQHLATFSTESRALASERDELGSVDLEVSFYNLDPFYRGLCLYLVAFLLIAVTWLRPTMRRTFRVGLAFAGTGLLLNVTGIVMRCIIRGRPPVSTLYETILFITACAALVALFVEWVDRRRVAGSMAPTLGALGLFVAMKFEGIQGVDTMPQLVAVLDTNFWLATHVTCITLGYSAGLLASAFAHVYLLGKVFGIRKGDDAGYRGVMRMVYGTMCFALIFSVVGTILGGVWANESWGRFWGWDPKENGALMIVLAQLAILHGRMGGHIKAVGICMSMIVQGCIVAFSWWGVNLLGVGLHSYGFADGVMSGLTMFYSIEGLVLIVAGTWWAKHRWWSTPSVPAT